MIDEGALQELPSAPGPKPRFYRRLGCLAGILIWLLVALFSCFALFLLIQEEVTISQGDAPGQEIRLWLVSEPFERGIGLSRSSVSEGSGDDALCVQTNVNFLLWQGEGDAISYCECYAQGTAEGQLDLTSATSGACTP